jgi:Ran GTPase-activating protein (RanGAP) involved in mRNA processing and transport
MDETREYSKDETFIWWDFVSCRSSIEFAKNFLDENEANAIFIIECRSAKDISQYSLNNNENEIILYPERQFKVISSFDCGNQLKFIQLKEIQQDHPIHQIPNIIRSIHQLESIISQYQQKSTINLSKQGLTDTDMNIVVNHGIIDKQCQKLLLSKNNIKSVGSSIIAKSLNKNTTLKFLCLSYNNLSDEGVRSLTKMLALNNSKLETLSLHRTGITDKSVPDLCNMLKKNKTLIWLHLGRNKITDKGIHLLADVLINDNNTLRALDLSHNKSITDSSVNSLVEIFQRNKSLETLWINNSSLSEEGRKKLKQNDQSNHRFFLLFVKDIVWHLPDEDNPGD